MKKLWAIALILILASAAGGYALRGQIDKRTAKDKFPLLSKRQLLDDPNDLILNLAPLRGDIRNYLDKTGIESSFYLDYLASGTSIRREDSDEFIGASLMKLPVIMDLYKAAELKRLKLDDEVTIDSQAISEKFGKLYQKGVGAKITLRQAAKAAITESDNTAARVILEQTQRVLDPKERSLNFLDVGLTESEKEQPVIYISAKAYTSFFKCLYLACFVNNQDSEEILDMLTQTQFHNWLEAGIDDKSVKIAHKIGTFSKEVSSDCGIVYLPKRPYAICLMFKSTDPKVDQHFTAISKMAYDYIKSQ